MCLFYAIIDTILSHNGVAAEIVSLTNNDVVTTVFAIIANTNTKIAINVVFKIFLFAVIDLTFRFFISNELLRSFDIIIISDFY